MSNYIQYLQHKVIEPRYAYQRSERANPAAADTNKQTQSWLDVGKRTMQIALPFISLCQPLKPLGSAISLTMGAYRSVTSFSSAYDAGQEASWGKCSIAVAQTIVAPLSIAAAFFPSTIGLLLSTGIDTALNSVTCAEHLFNSEWAPAFEEFMQTSISATYLASMLSGHLEIVLAVALLQTMLSFYQARREFTAELYPEAIAKVAMGMIRLNQAQDTLQLIQRRNFLLSFAQYQHLDDRIKVGREDVGHILGSDLSDLKVVVKKNEVILTDAKGKEYSFGSHFDGYGKGLVKGANLTYRTKVVDGKNMIEMDFKVNHVFRTKIQEVINETKALNPTELKEVLELGNSHAKDIRFEECITGNSFPVGNQKIGPGTKITLEGLGTITIGSSEYYHNLHDRVIVQMEEGQSLYAWHEMLSFLDLDTALRASTQDDLTRIKIGQLFRTIHPKEATQFERTAPFFDLSIDELKNQIIQQTPDMKQAFEQYLDKMEKRDILPGRGRYAMPGLAEESRKLGARALMSAVTGTKTDSALFDRVGSMLKMGMLSPDTRFSSGVDAVGINSFFEFTTGGADSVYTQMITSQNCNEKMPLNRLQYFGKVNVLISLEALETGTYQYYTDSFGTRRMNTMLRPYLNRPSIFDYMKNFGSLSRRGHEIMLKERVPQDLIKGLIVQDMQTRDELLQYLRATDIIQKNALGQEMILNTPVDKFIRVGTHASEALFA